MKRQEFIEGFEPQIVRIGGKPTVIGYIRNKVFRRYPLLNPQVVRLI